MSQYNDVSQLISTIITDLYIPKIKALFADFVFDDKDYLKPTKHLYNKLKINHDPFILIEDGFNSVYKIADIIESYGLFLEISSNGFMIRIGKNQNTSNDNNISISKIKRVFQ